VAGADCAPVGQDPDRGHGAWEARRCICGDDCRRWRRAKHRTAAPCLSASERRSASRTRRGRASACPEATPGVLTGGYGRDHGPSRRPASSPAGSASTQLAVDVGEHPIAAASRTGVNGRRSAGSSAAAGGRRLCWNVTSASSPKRSHDVRRQDLESDRAESVPRHPRLLQCAKSNGALEQPETVPFFRSTRLLKLRNQGWALRARLDRREPLRRERPDHRVHAIGITRPVEHW
jgi:hypothetical protein